MTSTDEIDSELETVLNAIKEHETALRNLAENKLRIEQSYYGLQGAKETLVRLKERIAKASEPVELAEQDQTPVS